MQTNNNSTSIGIHRYSLLDEEISDAQQELSDIEAVTSQNQSLLHESSTHQEDHSRSKKIMDFLKAYHPLKCPVFHFHCVI